MRMRVLLVPFRFSRFYLLLLGQPVYPSRTRNSFASSSSESGTA